LADDRPFPVPATTPEFFPCNDEIIPVSGLGDTARLDVRGGDPNDTNLS
jgi:hypothetical protein